MRQFALDEMARSENLLSSGSSVNLLIVLIRTFVSTTTLNLSIHIMWLGSEMVGFKLLVTLLGNALPGSG